MPGNEVVDPAHNFFAQDNSSQGQHHPQFVDGNWPVHSKNLWFGSQRQIGLQNFNTKTYNLQSDSERGNINPSLRVPHGLNFRQSTLSPEFVKTQSQIQQSNWNGFIHGNQVCHSRQNEANLLGMDIESDRHNLNTGCLSVYESPQGSVSELQTNASIRPETPKSPMSFDFLGGTKQISHLKSGVLQSVPWQQSGFNDMQQLQQEVIFRKMEELKRQQQRRLLGSRPQNSLNQSFPYVKQPSGGDSPTLVNGTPLSSASNYPRTSEITIGNTNLLQRGSPVMQGSTSGLIVFPNQGQVPLDMGLVHQQVDQSLYSIPVSNSRGSLNQHSHLAADKSPVQQIQTFRNSCLSNQYAVLPDQANMQDGSLTPRQIFQRENVYENGGIHMENLQKVNDMQRNQPLLELGGKQEQTGPSEILQEKQTIQAASQNNIALDPTEERILFGSDDGIWDAFGGNINITGRAGNLLGNEDFLNGFPSIQTGSWSALMQSAVAETSSCENGPQEEWSGLSCQNAEVPSENHQPLTYNNSGKQQTAVADENLWAASTLNGRSVVLSGDANLNNNYHSVSGFQQFGQKSLLRQQVNSSQWPLQQSSGGNKWSNQGLLQTSFPARSQMYGNVACPLDTEINANGISSSWIPQHSGSNQLGNKPNGWNVFESVPPGRDAASNIHENDKSVHHTQNNDQRRAINGEMSHGNCTWKANSVCSSAMELDCEKSSVGGPQVNTGCFSSSNAVAVPNSVPTRASEEMNEPLPDSHHFNIWKNVDSLARSKGSEDFAKSYHHLNKGTQVLDSSSYSFDKEEVKIHETENGNRKENYEDSYHSNVSHNTQAGDLRDNLVLDVNGSQTLPNGKQKPSNQVGRRTSVPCKFQYHPMGHLDEDADPSDGMRQSAHSLAMPQQSFGGLKSHDEVHFDQSKFFSEVSKNYSEMVKGELPNLQGQTKGFSETPAGGILSGHMLHASSSINGSVGIYSTSKGSQLSQNVLELLHRVDQSREQGTMMHFNSSELNPSSEMPEAEISDGSVGHIQRSQFSASQGYGLQLAPPSEGLPIPHCASSCQNSAASVQSLLPSNDDSSGDKNVRAQIGNEASFCKMAGNFSLAFHSGFRYSTTHLHNQQKTSASGEGLITQSTDSSFDRHAFNSKPVHDSSGRAHSSQSKETSSPDAAGRSLYDSPTRLRDTAKPSSVNHPHERVSAAETSVRETVPVSLPSINSGISQQSASPKLLSNLWTNVPSQQHRLSAQSAKVSSKISQPHLSNKTESTSSASQYLGDVGANKGQNGGEQLMKVSRSSKGLSGNIDLPQHSNELWGEEPIMMCSSDISANVSVTQNMEALGCFLKPNNYVQKNYSLLNQMLEMKSIEMDRSNRELKKLKGLDSSLDGQQVAAEVAQSDECSMVGDAHVHVASVPPADSKMQSFSRPMKNLEKTTTELGNVPSEDMFAFDQNNFQSKSYTIASFRVEQSRISPQMAPYWLNQFETFKNGKTLPIYDAQKAVSIKPMEQPFTHGQSSNSMHTLNSMEQLNAASEASQVGKAWLRSAPISGAVECFTSFPSLTPDGGDQNQVVLRPRKRKNASFELHPWHKEVRRSSKNLLTISIAEIHWAKAANRLTEKAVDDAETVEDGRTMLREKRRLILTTQLMQQLFCPPPAAILSADACSNYESVAYFLSRLTLRDACSLVSCLRSDSSISCDATNFLSVKGKLFERIDDQHATQLMEEFLGRARKLENNFWRLEKRASILNLKVECQDLEKFSIINRFAKFHGRGQADGVEISSKSEAAANVQKSCPQRYVTALQMPRNLPELVQCLSL